MSDGLTDGMRMTQQANAYQTYLEALAAHLLSPSETSEAPILSAARKWDSNTRGGSPDTGLASKVPRLLKALADNDKIAWANVVLGVNEECSREMHQALKDISPFKGKLIMRVSDWNGQSCDIAGELERALRDRLRKLRKNRGNQNRERFIVLIDEPEILDDDIIRLPLYG